MKLMEYQGKDLFRRVGIQTPKGVYATSADDVQRYIAEHPGSWVLKSQVMMGGRGKAGGIKFADDAAQGETIARELIGKVLRSVQNPDGEEVRSLLVEEKVDIASEAYVSITIDRATKKPVVLVTAQGGMDVEEVAERDPGAISKYWIDPAIGCSAVHRSSARVRARSCRTAIARRFRRSSARSTRCSWTTARTSSRSIRSC